MAVDRALFDENERSICVDNLAWAWNNYFVSLSDHSQTGSYRALG
jgi:hypothetical protein